MRSLVALTSLLDSFISLNETTYSSLGKLGVTNDMTDSQNIGSGATEDRSEVNCYVALTHDHLDVLTIMNRVRSPKAGAIVLFAGTLPIPSIH